MGGVGVEGWCDYWKIDKTVLANKRFMMEEEGSVRAQKVEWRFIIFIMEVLSDIGGIWESFSRLHELAQLK